MLVHIIADYGMGDLAFAEVVQRIKIHLPDAEPMLTPVPPFNTVAAGFCIAQLAMNPAPAGTLIYHNIAPRADEDNPRSANAGERLAFARLHTGVRVVGVNSGHSFSFIRDAAESLQWAAVPAEGSQFRSRDLFPHAAAAIALGQPDALADEIAPDSIPVIPQNAVAYVDGYGNLKTTISSGEHGFSTGQKIRVKIGEKEHPATVSDGSFGVKSGKLAFAPGSSGWTKPDGTRVTWMELFFRNGNAWESFGYPQPGADIYIS